MTRLSPKELDLLQRIDEKEGLRPLFFRKVKGLKWFDSLEERGYFKPEKNPSPVPAKEEGYVNIPTWLAIDYLTKTAPDLVDPNNQEYAEKFLKILVEATSYAIKNGISNYRTWWQFSEIISQIPHNLISIESLSVVDYWLDDKYEQGLVAQQIGETWLPDLLNLPEDHAQRLAKNVLKIIYKVKYIERDYGDSIKKESSLRFDYYHAKRITNKVAELAGEKLGKEAILVFDEYLKSILNALGNDLWSSIWQPSIEDHDQNKHRDDAENILVQAYRDSLDCYMRNDPKEASEHVEDMLSSDYQTIQRLAIHVVTRNFYLFVNVVDCLLDSKYLESNFRHEMWHFISKNYSSLSGIQKEKVLELISGISVKDDSGIYQDSASAYNKSIWLSAIKDHGEKELTCYLENIEITKTEPDHPDFSSYMSSGWGGRKSPKTLDDLLTLKIDELVMELTGYKDSGRFDQHGLEGLVEVFKQVLKTEPLKYYLNLNKFACLDMAYIYQVIEAYRDLWTEKARLPWEEIWIKLLEFCDGVIKQDRFWGKESVKKRDQFVANRYWIVSGIGRLIEAGTKSDEHAFNKESLPVAEKIILYLLDKEEGSEYTEDSDAVSISINSPRGHCLSALINLTLHTFRVSNNKDHLKIWSHFQKYYDSELDRADSKKPEYEFATLVANYLPNFLYMSKKWVVDNLSRIFDQSHRLKWLCAMQGYAYVGTIYKEIFGYLKDNDDLLKVLDDEFLRDKVEKKAVQNIAVAYINDFETLEEDHSLINILITRNDHEEINQLIWFMWTIRKRGGEIFKNKIYELWSRILNNIDLSTKCGRKTASQLCHWAVFVDQIDEERRQHLLTIAPYSDESHNSYELLVNISRFSEAQAFEAHEIWMKMLEKTTPDYPEEAVRNIFSNLLKNGDEGLRKAREVESEYIKKGNDRVSAWLSEIRDKT